MTTRHMFHTEGLTDIDKLRAQADEGAKGDSRTKPQTVKIHHHRHGEPCGSAKHEVFAPKED